MKHLKYPATAILLSLIIPILLLSGIPAIANGAPPKRQYYEIRIYHLSSTDQENRIDKYLKNALIPALHRNNIQHIGVFKALANDTAAIRNVYVVVPYESLEQFNVINDKIEKDKEYLAAGTDYIDAPFDNPPYLRIERIFSRAFGNAPVMQIPKLVSPLSERVYEMRSYESATEKLHAKKIEMFNNGSEIKLFKKLGFNGVFYSQALTGSTLPNLIYLITFDNMDAHDKLWVEFRNSPEWKKLSSMPEYQNVMSKANSYMLHPADYSDY